MPSRESKLCNGTVTTDSNFPPLNFDLVVESLGGWDDEAVATIRLIGRLLGQRHGIPPDESTRHLLQRLAIYYISLARERECRSLSAPYESCLFICLCLF